MKSNSLKAMFSSACGDYSTPSDLFHRLNSEFNFNDDPCPIIPKDDGLSRPWGEVTFVNPPYGRLIGDWIKKGYEESQEGKTVVMLLPSRTDTKWWHEYCMKAHEIRFIRGRLKFSGSKNSAPFPSAIVIFKGHSRKNHG